MTNYKLYYMQGACSMAVHVLLSELQQPFDLVNARDASGNKTAEFLSVNPRGMAPTLVTPTGHTIREGAAIITYLCDTHSNSLLPLVGPERATALEWLAFANSTLHPAYSNAMWLKRNNASAELQAENHKKIVNLWNEVEQQLAKTEYTAGNAVSPADILLTVIANWQSYISQPIDFGPNCKRLFATVTSRPSYQQALQTEQVTYKAAA